MSPLEPTDLTDEQLRAAQPLKWSLDGPEVLPAWVAEMDFALPEAVLEEVRAYAGRGVFGYPPPPNRDGLVSALVGFADRQWGWTVDPKRVTVVGDVMDGMRLALHHLTDGGAVVVPTPVYPPFLHLVRDARRELVQVAIDPDADAPQLPLEGIARAVAAGARTLLLCHPHNPVGHAWTAPELAALRDVVEPAGVHVVSDEIHAALTLPGTGFVPYATVASPDAPVTTLVSATKAFGMPGLRAAQIVSHRQSDRDVLRALPPALVHGMTGMGQVASAAAYAHGDAWLEAVRARIAANHERFRAGMAAGLPSVRIRPADAGYLAWLDLRALGVPDAAAAVAAALACGVRVDGQDYGEGGAGHVRVNLATSPARVDLMLERLTRAWG